MLSAEKDNLILYSWQLLLRIKPWVASVFFSFPNAVGINENAVEVKENE